MCFSRLPGLGGSSLLSRGFETSKLVIVNNTFAGTNPYRAGQIILATATSGLRVENNIFHAPNEAALYFENLRFPGGLIRNNMVHRGVMKIGRPRGVTFTDEPGEYRPHAK